MSEDLEGLLREAREQLAEPAPDDTLTARNRFLAAARTPSGRLPRRVVALALASALAVAGAFGAGYALAGGGATTTHVSERLSAGPGFLPADGWATGVSLDPQTGAIVKATATRDGTRIAATFAPASTRRGLPPRLLPWQLPAGGERRQLGGRVGAYAVEVTIRFPSAHPTAGAETAAREELDRLVVPSCPDALPLTTADRAAAKRYVLSWLPAHYEGDASDLEGATATATLGTGMLRYGEAAADCGPEVAANSAEVDVTLPKVEQISASLSQLTYFAARSSSGWIVWERAR
jgi:hypothetical protein